MIAARWFAPKRARSRQTRRRGADSVVTGPWPRRVLPSSVASLFASPGEMRKTPAASRARRSVILIVGWAMSLKEYERKRSFDKTPEPKPSRAAKAASAAGPFFCVQRHDATRLHYDFRLEIGGALASWAVPKGPTLEPLAKHLAVHVEDHPLDYGNFEGNIPKGEYGGGSVMLWDRGTWELLGDTPASDQVQRGDLKFRLHGEKLRGEFALILMRGRGKGNEWLLIKKKDAAAKPGWNIEDYARSVLTGRTQQEIAENLPAAAPPQSRAAKHSVEKVKGAVES